MTASKKIGLFGLWCAGLLTVLGCNLLLPAAESTPVGEGRALSANLTTLTTVPRTPLTTLLQAAVPTSKANATITKSAATATPIATPTPTPTPTSPPLIARVNVDIVNLRDGPGTNYAIVGQALSRDPITIVGRNEAGDWWHVCCPLGQGEESWVSAEFVDLPLPSSQSLAAIPLATIPTPPEPVAQAASGGNSGANPGGGAGAGLPGVGGFGAVSGTNPFTGLGGGRSGQRPLIVCINNDYAARPQLGLGQADLLYEYLMEGYGITRFSALFYGEESSQIGPVRSARLINYYMGALYDAGLACSGASDAVRYLLKHEAPFPYMDVDLDDPSNSRYSVSIGSDYRTRLRTSTSGLRQWLADWGVEKSPNLRGFTFGGALGGGVPANGITIPYPAGTGCQVEYRYDGGSGRYLRLMGGGAHTDGNTGAQVAVENVIVQVVPHEATDIVEDSLGSTSIRLNLFGSGQALVFRDGQAYAGTWRSDSRGDLPRFFDQNGAEVSLKPGKSWISIVPTTYTVSYQ